MPTELQFTAADGRPLRGTLHAPPGPVGAAVVVHGALGVPHPFYHRLAAWLAGTGLGVLTYDYRGVGASRDRPLREDAATLLDWAQLDAPAALDAAKEHFPGAAVGGLGHSFGGQAFGLNPRGPEYARIVVIGASTGDLSIYPPARRIAYHALLATAPVVGGVFGFAPGWMGLGSDLPAGVPAQWSRWCRTRGYARAWVSPTHYADITAPMAFFDLPGDTMAPPAAAAELRSWYTRAVVEHHAVVASELPAKAQGHFGVFRAGGEPVWARIAAFLARTTAP